VFTPRYLKQAKLISQNARKLLRYRKDLLKEDQLAEANRLIEELEAAAKARSPEKVEEAVVRLDKYCASIAPARKDAGLRENCEVILVAVAIAMGIRAYFLQPFKIPTGSMQPTLNGIIGYPADAPTPNVFKRVVDNALWGRNYIDVVSEIDNNQVMDLKESKRFFFFTYTQIKTRQGQYNVRASRRTLEEYFDLRPGKTYARGEPIVRGFIQTGDQVFVDKFSYHFRRPKRGEVFVFKTTGIPTDENRRFPGGPSQFYIKRLAGLPGDRLRIDPPDLYINGERAREWTFERVMSQQDGYGGYTNGSRGFHAPILGQPHDVVELPPNSYFALGDNSNASSDSRYWGVIPGRNLVGRGFFVYWPFTSHWGVIH
jgi:signal peptidase I